MYAAYGLCCGLMYAAYDLCCGLMYAAYGLCCGSMYAVYDFCCGLMYMAYGFCRGLMYMAYGRVLSHPREVSYDAALLIVTDIYANMLAGLWRRGVCAVVCLWLRAARSDL